jgi:hypothetical protein
MSKSFATTTITGRPPVQQQGMGAFAHAAAFVQMVQQRQQQGAGVPNAAPALKPVKG